MEAQLSRLGKRLQAHIHFGQRATGGGISIFLCTNLANGPMGTQLCPQPTTAMPTVTITGVVDATGVIGPAAQGIAPGELAEIIAAMRAGFAYANVHTGAFPTGEIRGQFKEKD